MKILENASCVESLIQKSYSRGEFHSTEHGKSRIPRCAVLFLLFIPRLHCLTRRVVRKDEAKQPLAVLPLCGNTGLKSRHAAERVIH